MTKMIVAASLIVQAICGVLMKHLSKLRECKKGLGLVLCLSRIQIHPKWMLGPGVFSHHARAAITVVS